jgi:hypothetical protein
MPFQIISCNIWKKYKVIHNDFNKPKYIVDCQSEVKLHSLKQQLLEQNI